MPGATGSGEAGDVASSFLCRRIACASYVLPPSLLLPAEPPADAIYIFRSMLPLRLIGSVH